MKLESTAISGKDILKLKPVLHGDTLETTILLKAIFESFGKMQLPDLAYSAHSYLAKGLALLAVEKASMLGGAACNQILAKVMRRVVEGEGLRFYVHESVPAGDGGISFGQAVVGGFSRF
jgi:hydrogenase maturation protein HypF